MFSSRTLWNGIFSFFKEVVIDSMLQNVDMLLTGDFKVYNLHSLSCYSDLLSWSWEKMCILLTIHDAMIKFNVTSRIWLLFGIDLMIIGFRFHLAFACLRKRNVKVVATGLYMMHSLCIEQAGLTECPQDVDTTSGKVNNRRLSSLQIFLTLSILTKYFF